MSLSLSLDQEGLKMTLLTLLHIRNAGLMIKSRSPNEEERTVLNRDSKESYLRSCMPLRCHGPSTLPLPSSAGSLRPPVET